MATKEPLKSRVKAKKSATKAKVKGKCKKASCAILGAFLAILCGCASSEPASRVTRAEYGDLVIKICESTNTTITLTIGDGALSSADSSDSTETQTANPTNTTDVKPDVDVNTTGGKTAGVLESAISAGVSLIKGDSTTTSTSSTATCTGDDCTYTATE